MLHRKDMLEKYIDEINTSDQKSGISNANEINDPEYSSVDSKHSESSDQEETTHDVLKDTSNNDNLLPRRIRHQTERFDPSKNSLRPNLVTMITMCPIMQNNLKF